MNKIGIICEYNPFHNGHDHHIKKIKEMFPDSSITLVMSGNFTQRGLLSILEKNQKADIAIKHNIDLVVELPFIFATQSADIFANAAISILKRMKVDYLVFGRFAVNLDYMDLNLLLEDVYHSFKNLSESKDIKIDFDYDEEEVIILGDYNKLKQVLINIIKNSIEAKKDDNPLNIKIKLFKVENEIKIEVIDDGVGIKDVKQIGKEFYTTKINGTGLGVNFSKTIISMHKGKIKYSSTLGKGTKVLITLPLTEV